MAAPVLDLSTVLSPTPKPIEATIAPYAPTTSGIAQININSTVVTDGTNTAYLSSIIKKVDGDSKALVLDAAAKFSDGTNQAVFDFEYDSDGEKFGAGTAFLQDD